MTYKILTIEDDQLVAEDLKNKLTSLGHIVVGNAANSDEALALAVAESPDLIIADIHIEGEVDGIATVSMIQLHHKCPVIYLTAGTDSAIVKRVMNTHPAAFLVKPFKLSEFSVNIDIAVIRFQKNNGIEKDNLRLDDSIFLPELKLHYRVKKKDIYYAEADGSYVKVFCREKRYSLTMNLKNIERQLDDKTFVRVSRKHVVNSDYISRINGNALFLKTPDAKEQMIAMSKDLRQQILDRFTIVKTKP